MITKIAAVALLAAQTAASVAPPVEPSAILRPSSDWYVDYGDDYCRLARQFGADEHKSVFYLEAYEPSSAFSLVVAGPDFIVLPHQPVTVHFGPGGVERTYEGPPKILMGEFKDGVMLNHTPLFEPRKADAKAPPEPDDSITIDPAKAKVIEWLDVRRGKKPPIRVALGQMGGPIEALNKCTDELLTHWGIDLAAHRNRAEAPKPIGNPGAWISTDDYPSGLADAGSQGIVFFRLAVDAKGKVSGCHIQRNTGSDAFEHAVCDLFAKRARFKPALDKQGKPMASYWRSEVRFIAGRG